MKEEQILEGIQKYFKIEELVGSRTAKKYGDRAWRFLDFRLLEALLIVRENLGKSITVNHGGMEQRGLRTNVQPMVKGYTDQNKLYVSAHILGKAVDFDAKGMTAEQVRTWIKANANLFPFKIRLEDGVSWVHMDVIWEAHNPQVYEFQP